MRTKHNNYADVDEAEGVCRFQPTGACLEVGIQVVGFFQLVMWIYVGAYVGGCICVISLIAVEYFA